MRYLYETHMHTSKVSACASSTPAEQARAYKDRGYAGVIVTEHFINGNSVCPKNLPWKEKMNFYMSGYEETAAEGAKCGLDVFFGLEFTIRGSDFLTYGIDKDFLLANPGMDKLPIEKYVDLVRKYGGYLAQAHPYRDEWYIERRFPVAPDLLDGVEVYNASMNKPTNDKALEFANIHGLPVQAGSDSHVKNFPAPSGVALADKAETIFDIINAIKERRAELILPA
jgi:predicted metal-dependent phosphoesterase TrpH